MSLKVVLDANLIASALIKPDSNPGKILDLVAENLIEWVVSPPIIREIKRILLYPKLRKYHQKTAEELDRYFDDLLLFAWVVEGERVLEIIQDDPSDNKYLAAAEEGEAEFIITGDHHLLDVKKYKSTRIVSAKTFLTIWSEKENIKR